MLDKVYLFVYGWPGGQEVEYVIGPLPPEDAQFAWEVWMFEPRVTHSIGINLETVTHNPRMHVPGLAILLMTGHERIAHRIEMRTAALMKEEEASPYLAMDCFPVHLAMRDRVLMESPEFPYNPDS